MNRLDTHSQEREIVVDAVWKIVEPTCRKTYRHLADLDREVKAFERQAANLVEAISEGGRLKTLVDKLSAVEEHLEKARKQKKAAEEDRCKREAECLSRPRVNNNLSETIGSLIRNSFELADFLRRIVPQFVIQPVQFLDSGLVRPRAQFVFSLQSLAEVSATEPRCETGFPEVHDVLDLFEPPLHIRHLPQCLAARAETPKLSLKKIAAKIGVNYMTVKRALDYARRMEKAGMVEPYRELVSRPKQASRWRTSRRKP